MTRFAIAFYSAAIALLALTVSFAKANDDSDDETALYDAMARASQSGKPILVYVYDSI